MTEFIDMTPTWTGILPALRLLAEGDEYQRNVAWEELGKMAKLADQWVAHCKTEQLPVPDELRAQVE